MKEKQENDRDKQFVVGVIGCGRIASNAHLPALQELDGVRIKYACDLIEDKCRAAREKFPKIEKITTDYRDILSDAEVDAVFVLTPNFAHYTVTMDALRAEKHVMCEKPITVNYALSCEMAREAERRNLILDIGVCNRYQRSVEMLEEYYRAGKFGKLYHVQCSFRSCRSIPGLGGAFTTKSLSGGGVLIDWGVHFLDLILYVLGGAKLKNVTCDAYSELAKDMKSYRYHSMWAEETSDTEHGVNDVDDFITGYVRTDKAGIAFSGAWAQNLDKYEMYVDFLGDKGGARLTYGDKFEFFDGKTLKTETPDYEIPNMYLCEDKAFVRSAQSGVKNRNHISNVLESAKLLDALYASAERKEEVSLS